MAVHTASAVNRSPSEHISRRNGHIPCSLRLPRRLSSTTRGHSSPAFRGHRMHRLCPHQATSRFSGPGIASERFTSQKSPIVTHSSLHKREGRPPLVIEISTLQSPGIQQREAEMRLISAIPLLAMCYSERRSSEP
jgi:hypothetical protein